MGFNFMQFSTLCYKTSDLNVFRIRYKSYLLILWNLLAIPQVPSLSSTKK